jgi:hypothetical protein
MVTQGFSLPAIKLRVVSFARVRPDGARHITRGMSMKRFLTTTVAALATALTLAGGASALTLQIPNTTTCGVDDFTIGTSNSSACEGAYDGRGYFDRQW